MQLLIGLGIKQNGSRGIHHQIHGLTRRLGLAGMDPAGHLGIVQTHKDQGVRTGGFHHLDLQVQGNGIAMAVVSRSFIGDMLGTQAQDDLLINACGQLFFPAQQRQFELPIIVAIEQQCRCSAVADDAAGDEIH